MGQPTLTRGRLAEHPLWSRALRSDELISRTILPVIVSDAVEERDHVGGVERLSITELVREARRAAQRELGGLLVFGSAERKDDTALIARRRDHVVARAIFAVKEAVPDLPIATDVCVCAYTAHGQCTLFGGDGADVAGTLEALQEIARVHADAGADLTIPSGMVDGSVAALRVALAADHAEVPVAAMVMLESALYASHRAAVGAVPIAERAVPLLDAGDPVAAFSRAHRDLLGGADAVVVKPGLPALDLVHALASRTDRPLISFHTADEHALVEAAAELVDADRIEREAIAASRRAGASLVVTYGAWRAAAA